MQQLLATPDHLFCLFCEERVDVKPITGRTVTLTLCQDCLATVDDEEIERLNISLSHMRYIEYQESLVMKRMVETYA